MISCCLDMSRIESGKMELNVQPMDMEDFVRSWRHDGPQAEQGLRLWKTDAVRAGPLATDRLRLEQVLINIIEMLSVYRREGCGISLHQKIGGQRLTFRKGHESGCQRSPGQHFQCF